MSKREYLTFSPDEFKFLGRLDALTDSKEQTGEIIETLSSLLRKEDIITNVTNYLLGYKIGTLETLLKRCGEYSAFDFESRSFKEPNGEAVDFHMGYDALERESRKQAKRSLKL